MTVANTNDGVRLWTSTEGRTWEQLPASPALDHTDQFNVSVNQVAAGPYGIMLTGELAQPLQPQPPIVIEKDDRILTFVRGDRITVTDASTGDVLLDAGADDPDAIRFDEEEGTISIVHPDTGEVLITFAFEEFDDALAKAQAAAGIDPGSGEEQPTTTVLWFSPDGQSWTSLGIEDTFGSAEFPNDVVVGNDAMILRWSGFMSLENEEEFEGEGEIEDPPDLMWVGRLATGQ